MSNANKFGLPPGLGGGNAGSRPRGVYEVPTDFVDLPSQGKFYPTDSPLFGVEKLEVKYMTAREEDLLVSPGLQKAGVAMDRVIESLLIDKRIRSKDLLVGDKNAILLNVRKNAFGDDYNFSYKCENCNTENKHTEYFSNMKIKELVPREDCTIMETGTIMMTLPVSKVTLEIKLLNGEDETAVEQVIQKRVSNNLPAEALLTRYRYMILSVNGKTDTETIVQFLETMPVRDSRFLRTNYSELNPNLVFDYTSDCSKCGHTNKGGVPLAANFFWPEL